MKKIIYLLSVFISIGNVLNSQDLSSTFKDSISYLTPSEVAFMIDKESRFLFRASTKGNSLVGLEGKKLFSIVIEKKLFKAFSASLSYGFTGSNSFYSEVDINGAQAAIATKRVGLELRYFYQHLRLINQNKQANNLSGNYLGATFQTTFQTANNLDSAFLINPNTSPLELVNNKIFRDKAYHYSLTYGIQKRFLNIGFIDFSLNLGGFSYSFDQDRDPSRFIKPGNNFFISSGVNAGVALGKTYEINHDLTCPIFRCFTNRNAAFKINLLNTWSFGRTEYLQLKGEAQWYVNINPNISYEIKIAKSPLSFEIDLDNQLSFANRGSNESKFGLNTYHLKYQAGFRYYHNMRTMIIKGKAGNNLSGGYTFARGQYEEYQWIVASLDPDNEVYTYGKEKQKAAAFQLGIGHQKEVLEKFYYDIGAAMSQNLWMNNDQSVNTSFNVIVHTKVGMMF